MNLYQEKWIEILKNANVRDWQIEPQGNDILINVPPAHSVSRIMENLPDVLATMSLDIDLPKERLTFILKNDTEVHDYVINPNGEDLNMGKEI